MRIGSRMLGILAAVAAVLAAVAVGFGHRRPSIV
jgi:hypothetical protein